MHRCKALLKIINIQEEHFLGPVEYLFMLIKNNCWGNDLKVKLKLREVEVCAVLSEIIQWVPKPQGTDVFSHVCIFVIIVEAI
jgi:hypothetical protein